MARTYTAPLLEPETRVIPARQVRQVRQVLLGLPALMVQQAPPELVAHPEAPDHLDPQDPQEPPDLQALPDRQEQQAPQAQMVLRVQQDRQALRDQPDQKAWCGAVLGREGRPMRLMMRSLTTVHPISAQQHIQAKSHPMRHIGTF